MPFSTAQYDRELREIELADIVENFRQRLDPLLTPLFLCDIAGACVIANQAYLNFMECTMEDAIGWNWTKFLHPDDKFEVYRRAQLSVTKKSVFDSNHRFITKTGKTVYVHATTHPIIGTNNQVGFIGSVVDETEKIELFNELRAREVFMKTMTGAMHEGIIVRDINGEIIHCNAAAESIFELTNQQITGQAPVTDGWRTIKEDGSPCAPDDHPAILALKQNCPLNDVTLGIVLPSGKEKWISVNASPLRREANGEVFGAVSTFIDITQRVAFQKQIDEQILHLNETYLELDLKQQELQQLNSKLKYQAETDALTLVFNRGAIMSRLNELINKSQNNNYGVILLDIDHFKSINDKHGHLVGDQTLQIVASLLSEHAPNGCAVGRYGGEEFLLVCSSIDSTGLLSLAEKIRQSFERINDSPVPFTASFGVAHRSLVTQSTDLIKYADNALYESKNGGRNRVTNYSNN